MDEAFGAGLSPASAPPTIGGVRTVVIPTNARALAQGSAPKTPAESAIASGTATLSQSALSVGLSAKQQAARLLMKEHPAFFGVGVGQSLDNPREAALVIYVDRKAGPVEMPAIINGMRTRYILMDRMHVTRSYATPIHPRVHCLSRPIEGSESSLNLTGLLPPLRLKLD